MRRINRNYKEIEDWGKLRITTLVKGDWARNEISAIREHVGQVVPDELMGRQGTDYLGPSGHLQDFLLYLKSCGKLLNVFKQESKFLLFKYQLLWWDGLENMFEQLVRDNIELSRARHMTGVGSIRLLPIIQMLGERKQCSFTCTHKLYGCSQTALARANHFQPGRKRAHLRRK